MSKRTIVVALAVLCCAVAWRPSAQAAPPAKYALMIGVTKYQHAAMNGDPPLEYPEVDAKSVGEFLSQHGYEVDYLLGKAATGEAIAKALEGLANKGTAEGVVVVGLFGHGVETYFSQEGGDQVPLGCFCPYDTGVRQATQKDGKKLFTKDGQPQLEPVPDSLVKFADLFASLKASGGGQRVIFADCCRNMPNRARGPAERSLGLGTHFKVSDLPEKTAVLFGCQPGKKSFEHPDWGHGAFTKCLLEEMESLAAEGRVTSGTLSDRVVTNVELLTAGDKPQVPQPFQNDRVDLQLKSSVGRPDVAKKKPLPDPMPEPLAENTADADRKAGELKEITLPGVEKLKLAWCPSGRFMMGSDDLDNNSDERPVHPVRLDGFWMGKTEVTQAQYEAVMGTEPWKEMKYAKANPNHAANYINHDDAVEFCRKLTDLERKANRLPNGWKYCLPTEAQWEYAARAGTTTRYSFGDDYARLVEYAWCDENAWDIGERYPHEVDRKKPNLWGLCDMHGNVWEWCSDWYADSYRSDQLATNPTGPDDGRLRVIRGGGLSTFLAIGQTCSERYYGDPSSRFETTGCSGFRIVLTR